MGKWRTIWPMPVRRARPYHHGDLRRALLREATALLRARGVEALSLRELARRLNVTPAAPYAHFPDKAALLAALSEAGFRTLGLALRRAFKDAATGPIERLRAMAREYVGFAVEHPAHFRLMFGSERPPIDEHAPLHRAAHDVSGVMLDAVVDCQRAGYLAPGDPMELVVFVWVIIHGIAVLVLADFMPGVADPRRRRADAIRLAGDCFDRALHGLAPRAAGRETRRTDSRARQPQLGLRPKGRRAGRNQ
jgi:AcrR family transcriptional regulator